MHRFYQHDLDQQESFLLNQLEAHHLLKVLRLTQGSKVVVTNGKGLLATCLIEQADKKNVQLSVLERNFEKKAPVSITMAVALTKSLDRYTWFLEKACEIGVDQIVPIVSQNSERKKINNPDRLQKVLISAMKQSQSAFLPKLHPITRLNEFLEKDVSDFKLIAHCQNSTKKRLTHLPLKGDAISLLIGPEGDFTDKEVQLAESNQVIAVSLGKKRLRVETAALTGLIIIDTLSQG